jgi:hypothetical protein
MIYEFRTYTLKPRSLAEVREALRRGLRVPEEVLTARAFWHTEVGPLNEIIHVWGYTDLAERARIRAEAAKDANWPPKIGEFVIDQNVEVLTPFPFLPRHHAGDGRPDLRDPPLQPNRRLAAGRQEAVGGEHRRAGEALAGGDGRRCGVRLGPTGSSTSGRTRAWTSGWRSGSRRASRRWPPPGGGDELLAQTSKIVMPSSFSSAAVS